MDSKEISTFKKTIDDLVKSENGDCMYQDAGRMREQTRRKF